MAEHIFVPIGTIVKKHSINFIMFSFRYKQNCKGNFIQIHHPTGPTVQSYWHHGKWTDVFNSSNSSKLNINVFRKFHTYRLYYCLMLQKRSALTTKVNLWRSLHSLQVARWLEWPVHLFARPKMTNRPAKNYFLAFPRLIIRKSIFPKYIFSLLMSIYAIYQFSLHYLIAPSSVSW